MKDAGMDNFLSQLRRDVGLLNPDESWVRENKIALLGRLRVAEPAPSATSLWCKIEETISVVVSRQVFAVARQAAVMLLVAGVAVGGWIVSASASQNSLPGEALYGVKLAIERTEVSVAEAVGASEVAAIKELDFAARRAREAKKSPRREQKVVALQSLQQNIASANKRLDKAQEQSPEQAASLAKVVTQKTDQILESLAADNKSVAGTVQGTAAVSQEVHAAEKLIEETGVKAVKVLIANNGDASEVKEVVEKKLENVAKALVGLNQDASLAASTSLANGIAGQMSLVTGTVSTSVPVLPVVAPALLGATNTVAVAVSGTAPAAALLAPVVGVSTTSASGTTAVLQDVQVIHEKVEAAEARLGEAKSLIQGNNLLGAIEKVAEVYSIKNEAKQVATQLPAPALPKIADPVTLVTTTATPSPLVTATGSGAQKSNK
ncbi:MAG: hypothetical protein HY984_01200 [Candidatus Magasanikbacteria bacterium]|nr:hypothetical protein [Candidatus Magasanikbacteria bacterium]